MSSCNITWWLTRCNNVRETPSPCAWWEPQEIISQLMIHRGPVVLRSHKAEPCCLHFSMAEKKQASPSLVDEWKKSKNSAVHISGGTTGSKWRFLLCSHSVLCLRASPLNWLSLVLHQANAQKRPRWGPEVWPSTRSLPVISAHHCPLERWIPLSKSPR